MQAVFNRYINYLQAEKNASAYTVRNYTSNIMEFFYYLQKQNTRTLEEVNKERIRKYLGSLKDRNLTPVTISGKLSAVRSFFRYLMREQIIKENPLIHISSPKQEKRLPSFLTVPEVKQLLDMPSSDKPQGQRDRSIIELFYASGMRVSELVGLDMENINMEALEIRVLGKGSRERIVLIGKPAAEALSIYLNDGRNKLLGEKRNLAVFINQYGNRLPPRRVQKILDSYAVKAGMEKKVHPHLLRHTFATHLLDRDADLRVVQELLGHASLSTTQIYTHISKSQARKVYLAAHPLAKEEGK